MRLNLQYFGSRGSSSGKKGGGSGGVGGSGGSSTSQTTQTQQQPTQPTMTTVTTPVQPNVGPFTAMTDTDAAQLVANVSAYQDPDFQAAQKLYISDTDPYGLGYSYAQNLNYQLDNGLKLGVNEAFIDENLQWGMHAMGQNKNLYRYAHDSIIQQLGISDYTNMSESQLQQALIGKEMVTTSYMSTSYDPSRSPFAPNAPLGGGREVTMNIKCGANTNVCLGARKQAEVVINKDTRIRVTGVRVTNDMVYPRNGSAKPRIELDIETF